MTDIEIIGDAILDASRAAAEPDEVTSAWQRVRARVRPECPTDCMHHDDPCACHQCIRADEPALSDKFCRQ